VTAAVKKQPEDERFAPARGPALIRFGVVVASGAVRKEEAHASR
jgi:hypothetical protein